jgi:hypothetical protein
MLLRIAPLHPVEHYEYRIMHMCCTALHGSFAALDREAMPVEEFGKALLHPSFTTVTCNV